MNSELLKGRKVIFILETPGIGGAEKQALMMATYFSASHQCKIEFLNLVEGDHDLENLIKSNGFGYKKIIFPGSQNTWKQQVKKKLFIQSLRKKRPALLMPYLENPNIFCSAWWKETGAAACFWNQRDEGLVKFEYELSIFKTAVQNATCFISNSKGGALYLERSGADKNKIEIIRNAIPEKMFRKDDKQDDNELGKLKQEFDFIACMTANIHSNKDHFTLIKAWNIVCNEFEKQTKKPLLILAGTKYDDIYTPIMELIRQLHIEKYIKFLGFWKRPDLLLSISDLYIHSSNSEGTSNSILEAMAAGKPVVATKILSILDTVSPANQQYLSEPGNHEQMAGYILQLSQNEILRKSSGQSNFDHAKENYSVQSMHKKMDQLLVKYLSGC